MTPNSTLEAAQQNRRVYGTTRHILLVRHGQYDESSKEDEHRILTPLGLLQAIKTGQRLATLARGSTTFDSVEFQGPCTIRAVYSSDMVRAKQTADLIAKELHTKVQPPDPLLNEALPSPMIPIRPDIEGAIEEIDANHDRIEQAFRKYIYRGDEWNEGNGNEKYNSRERHEFDIIVCHGNVIRYFFCRALQLPPEAWLRMSVFNCSLTYLIIRPNGHVSARMMGDIGHLDYDESTFSNYYGYKW